MFGKRIRLFELLGFEVRVDLSWAVIAVLVAWSLSTGFFPFEYKGLSPRAYWLMGTVGALGLFLSIIIHEFAHSLVARRYGLPMQGITLFIFGGVAEMAEEPPHPKAEFWMAVVGPLSSFALAAVFYGVALGGEQVGWPAPIGGVLRYLMFINALLALFNLVPAFPLDGGRILRSLLWYIKGNLRWATRISAVMGTFFGFLLMGYGFWRIFDGYLFGGMWMILIGMFVQSAAKTSYQQLLVRSALEGEPVRRFMKSDLVTVPPTLPVDQLVEDYIYRYHYKMYPVIEAGRLSGCVMVQRIKELPREQWTTRTAAELAMPCAAENTVDPQTDAVQLLSTMKRTGITRYMVVEDGRLVGIISLKDLLGFLSMKMELEEGETPW